MEKEITIWAGNNEEAILDLLVDTINTDYCRSEDEFKYEYPEDVPTKYRVKVSIEEEK